MAKPSAYLAPVMGRPKISRLALGGAVQLLLDVLALALHRTPRRSPGLEHRVAVRVLARCAEAETAELALAMAAPGPVCVWTEVDPAVSQGQMLVVVERERDLKCRMEIFDLHLFEPPAHEDSDYCAPLWLERQLERLFE